MASETSAGAASRLVEALRTVCSMKDEASQIVRSKSSQGVEPASSALEPGPAPWPVTPTPSEREAELQRAQKTNIWDWRLKGRFREKPKLTCSEDDQTKETRKAMFMYKKHREAVSNLGIFKIDQDITAYEQILQEGIDKRNSRKSEARDVPPLPIRPASAAVSSTAHSRSQDFTQTAALQSSQGPKRTKASMPARPASAASHVNPASVSHDVSSGSSLQAPPSRKKSSPGGQPRPASAALAADSPDRSKLGSGERAKSAMPWMRHSTSTTDGKTKDSDTFLTACREESRESFESGSARRLAQDSHRSSTNEHAVQSSSTSTLTGKREAFTGSTRAADFQPLVVQQQPEEEELTGGGGEEQGELSPLPEFGEMNRGGDGKGWRRKLELAESMKPPELRQEALAQVPRRLADCLPASQVTYRTEYQHGREYLQTLRNDLQSKVTALEELYEREDATPRTLEAIVARKNGLNAGWTRESLAALASGQQATEEAARSLSDIDLRTTEFCDVLTVMTEEWLRVDDMMDHVDLLMKAFDSMADGHLLLSGNALPARIEDEAGMASPARVKRHLMDETGMDVVSEDGGSTQRSLGIGGKDLGNTSPQRGLTNSAGSMGPESNTNSASSTGSLTRQPTQLMRQGTMQSMGRQSSAKNLLTPSYGKSARREQVQSTVNLERQKALAVQDFLDSAGVDAAKVYNAAIVDRAFMGEPDIASKLPAPDKQTPDKSKESAVAATQDAASGPAGEAGDSKSAAQAQAGGDESAGEDGKKQREEAEVTKGEEDVEGSELRWHHGMAAVRNVIKSGTVKVRAQNRGTQIPEQNEIEWTISHQLKGKPKFIKDFAVRGLNFPPEWEAFLGGLPPHAVVPKLLSTPELSQTILDIYFSKLLHENKEATLQEFKMSMAEYVCFHLLEQTGDMDDAKISLRDLAYSVAEQYWMSNKFRLFARFCGILQAVPDVILDFYLLFMLECKPFIVKPLKEGSALHKLVSQGRDFIMADFMATVVEKAFYQSAASAREFAIKSKLSKIPIHRQVEDAGQKMDLCDVDDMWLNVSAEFEQQYEQGRVEAGNLLLAADVNHDGTVDLEEFMEIIRLFDPSFSKAQVAKMYFDAIAESGSDCITQKAFLTVGDKYKLFQTRGLKMLDLAQRDVSALHAQSLQMLRKALEIEDEKIVQRINIFANAEKEQEAKGKEIMQAYEDLKAGVEDAHTLMEKVGEDSSLVPDPTPLWDQYHEINRQLAGVILNFGVRRVINTLTVLGKMGKNN